jgi:hypothetical protein
VEFLPLGLFIPDNLNSTIQSCVNAAAKNPRAAVWIPAFYSGTDTYTNPSNVPIFDMRGAGSISFGSSGTAAFYATTFSNQTSVTVLGSTHNLGTADLSVTVWNSATGTRSQIIPNTVQVDSTTFNVTVTFVQSQSGRIVIAG